MLRNILLAAMLLVSVPAFSQFTLGLKFSPTISTNRLEASSDSVSFSSDGPGLRFAVGPIADIEIRENYFVSTGLLFVSKRVGVKGTNNNNQSRREEDYGLQYLQVPLTLKLFTNEVALDKKIYFQVGGTLEFNINEEPKDQDNIFIEDFFFFDSSLLIGMGMEYRVGVNTVVFAGLSYQRGLVNSVSDHVPLDGDISMKNDYISLDLGVKF